MWQRRFSLGTHECPSDTELRRIKPWFVDVSHARRVFETNQREDRMAYRASAMTWSRSERTCLFQDLGSEIRGGLRAGIVFSTVRVRRSMEDTITSNESPSCFRKLRAHKSVVQHKGAQSSSNMGINRVRAAEVIHASEERFETSRPSTVLTQRDPMRAHGAWIYLFASVAAGALVGAERGLEPAMLVATGFVGAFLVTAAIARGVRRKGRQTLVGASLAALAPLAALWLGAEPSFLVVAAIAALPAVAAVVLAKRLGFLSHAAVVMGIAALAMAAPVTAVAGGATALRSAVLFGLLWSFFCRQSLRVSAALAAGGAWDRKALRARGLREAAITAVWALVVAVSLRIF